MIFAALRDQSAAHVLYFSCTFGSIAESWALLCFVRSMFLSTLITTVKSFIVRIHYSKIERSHFVAVHSGYVFLTRTFFRPRWVATIVLLCAFFKHQTGASLCLKRWILWVLKRWGNNWRCVAHSPWKNHRDTFIIRRVRRTTLCRPMDWSSWSCPTTVCRWLWLTCCSRRWSDFISRGCKPSFSVYWEIIHLQFHIAVTGWQITRGAGDWGRRFCTRVNFSWWGDWWRCSNVLHHLWARTSLLGFYRQSQKLHISRKLLRESSTRALHCNVHKFIIWSKQVGVLLWHTNCCDDLLLGLKGRLRTTSIFIRGMNGCTKQAWDNSMISDIHLPSMCCCDSPAPRVIFSESDWKSGFELHTWLNSKYCKVFSTSLSIWMAIEICFVTFEKYWVLLSDSNQATKRNIGAKKN